MLSLRSFSIGGAIIVLGVLFYGGFVSGLSIFQIVQGGTGTSTAPTYGKLFVGNAAGTWDYVSTSSLGIIGTADGAFSTTSANHWSSVGLGFSTTSSNYWSAFGLGFSTTSTDYWETQQAARGADGTFSTTSATYWSTFGLGFSTTSANVWSAFGLGFSTTSAAYWKTQNTFEALTAGDGLTRTSDDFDCDTASGTVFGCITAANWTTFNMKVATSAAETRGQLAYWGTTAGSPATLNSVATSSVAVGSAFSYSGTLGAFVGGSGGTLSSVQTPAFTFATSTAWAGTTTIPLGPAYYAETWNNVKCFTDTGTLWVAFDDGTNVMNYFQASTTVGTITLSNNNSYTASEKRYVKIGNPASSPTTISCTVNKTI